MSWRRCATPREQDNIHNPAITVDSFFSILMFIGCFSAATIAAAAEIPAGGGYSSVLAGGDYQTEAEVMVGFQTVAVGCANYSGGLTICYDAYEIVSIPPWSDFGDWAWSRIVETRIPVRRTVNGIDGGTNYEYTTGRIVLRYFCPAGYPQFTQSESTWQPGTGWPSCTDGLPPPPPPPATCPVTALPPIPADDVCAQTLEAYNSTQAQKVAACGTLTPAMQTAVGCFRNKLTQINDPATGQPIPLVITADIRNIAYQAHFREVWDKMEDIVRETRDNPTMQAVCAARRAEVAAEKGCDNAGPCTTCYPSTATTRSHCIVSRPAQPNPNDATHVQGNAIDVSRGQTVDPLQAALNLRTPPQSIQDMLNAPRNCRLDYLGAGDPVHFQLRP